MCRKGSMKWNSKISRKKNKKVWIACQVSHLMSLPRAVMCHEFKLWKKFWVSSRTAGRVRITRAPCSQWRSLLGPILRWESSWGKISLRDRNCQHGSLSSIRSVKKTNTGNNHLMTHTKKRPAFGSCHHFVTCRNDPKQTPATDSNSIENFAVCYIYQQ